MTLVLTELSNAGIAMAADSAITRIRGGRIIEVDRHGWLKLLRVPRIRAAISYWGAIGAVTNVPFHEWLQRVINSRNYDNLDSFADHLVEALNTACHGRPLAEGRDTGVHLAGYTNWSDGERRPTFIHIHNGHGRMSYGFEYNPAHGLVALHPSWIAEPRTLFEKHQDFPSAAKTIEEEIQALESRYITRNGDYSLYALIGMKLDEAYSWINLIPGTSIPRDPNSLSSRKGFLHITLEMMISIYKCSNRSRTIGGKVTSLGIAPDRYL